MLLKLIKEDFTMIVASDRCKRKRSTEIAFEHVFRLLMRKSYLGSCVLCFNFPRQIETIIYKLKDDIARGGLTMRYPVSIDLIEKYMVVPLPM